MKAVVVLSGIVEDGPRGRAAMQEAALIVAADGGAVRLQALGAVPHILIGDLDSVSPELAAKLEGSGVKVVRHPARKDRTDSELALQEAVGGGATEITVLGARGG